MSVTLFRRALVALALVPAAGALALAGVAVASGPAGASGSPSVTRISPISVPAGTSIPIKIHGHGFDTAVGAASVSFGGTPAVSVSCSSPSSCVAVSPNLTVGSVQVVLTSNGTALNGETLTVNAYDPPLVRLVSNAKGRTVFSVGGLSDNYPATGAEGYDAVTIENTTDASQTFTSTPTGDVTLAAGDSDTVALAADDGPYVFYTTSDSHTSTLTVKTHAPQ